MTIHLPTIAVRPTPRDRETLLSYLSRAAAMRGLGLWEFTSELGLSQKALIALDPDALTEVGALFELSPDEIAELVSWSPRPVAGVRMQFRNEQVVSRAVVNPTIRGCPECLREDTAFSDHAATDGMVIRGDWQFRHVAVCIWHRIALAPLWTETRQASRFDFSTWLRRLLPNLMDGRVDAETAEVTAYDQWLDTRLSSATDPTWLAQFPIDVAAQVCQLLGGELMRRQIVPAGFSADSPARAVGFEVAQQGPEAIREALRQLADRASGPNDESRKAFGRLHDWLSNSALEDHRYDPFRDMLREVVLDVWPVAAGTKVLGVSLDKRLRHSVVTAAEEARVSPALMRRLLIAEGAVQEDDPRPDARLTFPTEALAPLLAAIGRLVGPRELARRLGCGEHQLEALALAGVLTPRFPPEATRRAWDPAEAERLLADLSHGAESIAATDTDWEHVHRAALRARVGIDVVIAAIRAGQIASGRHSDLKGYAAIFVRKEEVDAVIRPPKPAHQTMSDFAREVGLAKNGAFRRLVEHGHASVTVLYNPQTRRHDRYVTPEDAAAFYARFTTHKLLSTTLGESSREVALRLRKAGIPRFRPGGEDLGPIYRVEDVAPVMRNWRA